MLADGGAEQAQGFHLLHQFGRVFIRLVEFPGDGAEFLFHPLINGGKDLLFGVLICGHGNSRFAGRGLCCVGCVLFGHQYLPFKHADLNTFLVNSPCQHGDNAGVRAAFGFALGKDFRVGI